MSTLNQPTDAENPNAGNEPGGLGTHSQTGLGFPMLPSRQRTSRLNVAIHECLDACYLSDQPLKCLAVFIDQLRRDPSWAKDEVEQVERVALHVVMAILDR